MTEREREAGRALARKTQESEEETRARVARIRDKQGRGETLTREEAGTLGAQASLASTRGERREAEREGRREAFEEAHKVATWTNAPGEAREPSVTPSKAREAERIREQQERGAKLSRHEAGVLGGVMRAEEGGAGDGKED